MKKTLITAALSALFLTAALGQGQLENTVVYDKLNQAGTPIDGFAGVIISQDIDTTRKIYRVEAVVDVERIGAAPAGTRATTISLVVGTWNAERLLFQGEFGDWAMLAGSYLLRNQLYYHESAVGGRSYTGSNRGDLSTEDILSRR